MRGHGEQSIRPQRVPCPQASAVAAGAMMIFLCPTAWATEIYVAPGGSGTGGERDPLGSIQAALDRARDGDVVTVAPGTYSEALVTRAPGVALRAALAREAVITAPGRVLEVVHERVTVEGIVIDGQYGEDDAVKVREAAHGLVLRNTEVRRAGGDCIDMGGPAGVLIEDCLVHHCLRATHLDSPDHTDGCASGECRVDAHGIVAGPALGLTIRGTEVHTFSGDAVQLDPDRMDPGWNDLVIEGCLFWLEPLPAAENGFAAGVVPGENAVDTKTWADADERARITIRDTVARGFRGGLITNMAAFNLKENIDAVIDGVTVSDSEIAFRTRGETSRAGAWVRIQNAVVYDVDRGVRFEDDIENLRIWSSTFGRDVAVPLYRDGSAPGSVLDVRNVLVLANDLPPDVPAGPNLALGVEAFVDATSDDYHLADGALAIDVGEALAEVAADRDGTTRPQGDAQDVGAYEVPEAVPPGQDADPGGDADADDDGGGDGGERAEPDEERRSRGRTGCNVSGAQLPGSIWLLASMTWLVRWRSWRAEPARSGSSHRNPPGCYDRRRGVGRSCCRCRADRRGGGDFGV